MTIAKALDDLHKQYCGVFDKLDRIENKLDALAERFIKKTDEDVMKILEEMGKPKFEVKDNMFGYEEWKR